jgi:hypothetical protein
MLAAFFAGIKLNSVFAFLYILAAVFVYQLLISTGILTSLFPKKTPDSSSSPNDTKKTSER